MGQDWAPQEDKLHKTPPVILKAGTFLPELSKLRQLFHFMVRNIYFFSSLFLIPTAYFYGMSVLTYLNTHFNSPS